jgi:hypothetical protein
MANGAMRADQAVSFSDFEFRVILGAQLTELSDFCTSGGNDGRPSLSRR